MKFETNIFTTKNKPENGRFLLSIYASQQCLLYRKLSPPSPPLTLKHSHALHVVPDPGTALLSKVPLLHNFPYKLPSFQVNTLTRLQKLNQWTPSEDATLGLESFPIISKGTISLMTIRGLVRTQDSWKKHTFPFAG